MPAAVMGQAGHQHASFTDDKRNGCFIRSWTIVITVEDKLFCLIESVFAQLNRNYVVKGASVVAAAAGHCPTERNSNGHARGLFAPSACQ